MSLKSDILKAAAPQEGEAELAGHKIRIRGLTAGEEIAYFPPASGDQPNGRAICAACIIDDKGGPLFTEAELSGMKATVLTPVFNAIVALSFPDMKALEKN